MLKILNVGQWYSGSSAVLDLLGEHEDVWLMPDNKANNICEFDGYRLAWIDQIAKVIDDCKPQRIHLLNENFKRIMATSVFSNFNDNTDKKAYIEQINYIYIREVNRIIESTDNNKKDLFLRISTAWIDMLCEITNKENIVFDQAIASSSCPVTYNKIFTNNKVIVTERNIFDQITDIQLHSTFFWIIRTGGSIVDFIQQNTKERKYWRDLSLNQKNIITIQFEDLVLNPEETSEKIFNFLELSPKGHKAKEKYFKPDVSAKNINKFKNFLNSYEIELIESTIKNI